MFLHCSILTLNVASFSIRRWSRDLSAPHSLPHSLSLSPPFSLTLRFRKPASFSPLSPGRHLSCSALSVCILFLSGFIFLCLRVPWLVSLVSGVGRRRLGDDGVALPRVAGQSATHHFASSNDTSHVVIPILDASRLADWVVIGELLIGWAVVLARNAAGARLAMAILVSLSRRIVFPVGIVANHVLLMSLQMGWRN